ncbi:MAG: tyrosine-type recombinase/integrase, partial [Bacteroidetes bacterium]|nr:tyrosine-type recombinase/integrase [Bacteroidota bacterium]
MKSEPKKTAKKAAWIVDESKFLSFQEIIRLRKTGSELKIIGQNIRRLTAIRRWFVLELGLHTGLRVSEMASLKYKNIFLDKDKSSILVKGKGGKNRIVWIGSQFRAIFRVYNSLKESLGYATNVSSFVLMNLEGNNISKRSLQEDFKLAGKLANLPKRYSIHSLRHTYATLLLR